MSRLALAFWLIFAAGMAVYPVIVAWSLPTISAAAGGLTPFDLRPSGYSYQEARAFLAALTPEGVDFYRTVQHRLDIVYPPLIAASLFLGIALLAPPAFGRLRWLLAAVALPIMVFDWLENIAVGGLLALGPAGITPEEVAAASRWTVLKSGFSTVAMLVLLALLILWTWRRFRPSVGGA
ncbi:MAG TPA: hypothetical protein VMW31_05875 [Devosiaceae bacterium]|nr:hypothetical protein [Devosiaceae bacterium]